MTPAKATADSASDLMPQPPRRPELEECCGSGCNPCVFDLYEMALERYSQALQAWRRRHPNAPDHQSGPKSAPENT